MRHLSDGLHRKERIKSHNIHVPVEALGNSDIVVDPLDDVGRDIHLEGLAERAALVGDADDDALDLRRRDRSQREHMPSDYILLYGVHIEITFCVPPGNARVSKPVDLMCENRLVPVVQEIVVKESSSYQALAVHLDVQGLLQEVRHQQRELGNGHTMFEHGSRPVLHELFCLLSFGIEKYITAKRQDLLGKLILGYLLIFIQCSLLRATASRILIPGQRSVY